MTMTTSPAALADVRVEHAPVPAYEFEGHQLTVTRGHPLPLGQALPWPRPLDEDRLVLAFIRMAGESGSAARSEARDASVARRLWDASEELVGDGA